MKVTAVIIGGGSRGSAYAAYALQRPDLFQIVGLAEPQKVLQEKFKKYKIPDDRIYNSWTEASKSEKFADCALITTQDQLHKEPAIAFARKGYHILLEKPMAVTYEDCKAIADVCKEMGVLLAVCHVLRYAPEALKLKELIDNGTIGDIVSIQHMEPIGFWHFTHSYVRGNWRNKETSSFSLLTKSCHDIDLILMLMGNKKCTAVSSFGSLKHFRKENKPKEAAARCLDCSVEEKCQFSAKKIYLGAFFKGYKGWPLTVLTPEVDIENLGEALKTGPYGRCVYDCDNNVNDNQVVNLQFDDGATVSFTMIAFTEKLCDRNIKVFGTKGELSCEFDERVVHHYDFLTRQKVKHDCRLNLKTTLGGGHGGADFSAIDCFIKAVATGDASHILTGPEESLASHYLCFAAEKSRLEKRVIDLTKEEIALV